MVKRVDLAETVAREYASNLAVVTELKEKCGSLAFRLDDEGSKLLREFSQMKRNYEARQSYLLGVLSNVTVEWETSFNPVAGVEGFEEVNSTIEDWNNAHQT